MFDKTGVRSKYYLFFIENNPKGLEIIHKYFETDEQIKVINKRIESDFIILLVSSHSPLLLKNSINRKFIIQPINIGLLQQP